MKRLVLASLLMFSSNLYAIDSKDCAGMEPIHPDFGECLEGFDSAMDLITSNKDIKEEVQFRAINSIDDEGEEN